VNVTLTPQLEELVKHMVESGLYRSPQEVIDAAIHLLDERNRKLAALRADVQKGLDQLARGEYTEYTDDTLHELFDEVSERGHRWLEAHDAKQSV
jgi:antitoxin ParD1/3/4